MLFESTILKTVLFIGYAAAIVGLCWEKVVPLFGRIGARRRTERRVSLLLAGMLLFFFRRSRIRKPESFEHYASRPGLYHLHINPYYQQIAFWD